MDQLRNIQKSLNTCVWLLIAVVVLLGVSIFGDDLREAGKLLVQYAKLL